MMYIFKYAFIFTIKVLETRFNVKICYFNWPTSTCECISYLQETLKCLLCGKSMELMSVRILKYVTYSEKMSAQIYLMVVQLIYVTY